MINMKKRLLVTWAIYEFKIGPNIPHHNNLSFFDIYTCTFVHFYIDLCI